MKKRILITTLLFGTAFLLNAKEFVTKLIIWDINGQKYEYLLDSKPKLIFEEQYLLVSTIDNEMSYSLANLARFTYENTAIPAGVIDIETGKDYVYTGNALIFQSLPAGCKIYVYSINGTLILCKNITNSGQYALPLSTLSTGNYLINVNGRTIKILKK